MEFLKTIILSEFAIPIVELSEIFFNKHLVGSNQKETNLA